MKIAIEEYYVQLMAHDWYYGFSDDGGVWRRGEASFKALEAVAKAEGGIYEIALDAFCKAVSDCTAGRGTGEKPTLEAILATPVVVKQTHEEWLVEFRAKAAADDVRRAAHRELDIAVKASVQRMNNRQYWFHKPVNGSMRTILIPADGGKLYEVRSLEQGNLRFDSWWAVIDHLQHL